MKDPNNKYGLDLEESLARAKKGKLMEGKVFYVSGKSVSSSVGLLKNVVSACGGQVCLFFLLSPNEHHLNYSFYSIAQRGSETHSTHPSGRTGSVCYFVPGRRLGMAVVGGAGLSGVLR